MGERGRAPDVAPVVGGSREGTGNLGKERLYILFFFFFN